MKCRCLCLHIWRAAGCKLRRDSAVGIPSVANYAASNSPNLKRVANCHYTATYKVPEGEAEPSAYEDDTEMDG